MSSIKSSLEQFAALDAHSLALPGGGATWDRFETLAATAARDLSLGRVCEGHADALAILAEAEMKPVPHAIYGVWAAKSRVGGTVADAVDGGWRLHGRKEFCSGTGLVTRALVSADAADGYRLFDVAVEEHVSTIEPDSWPAVGMAASSSETLTFDGPVLGDEVAVGPPGFYTERPGFWFGAIGVAACWYGGAVGLVTNLARSLAKEPSEHVWADFGLAVALLEEMRAVLKGAAEEIDADPVDRTHRAHYRALVARQSVHRGASEVLALVGAAGGARALCHDAEQARRAADLVVYLSQHHGRADAAALGRLARENGSWS